MDDVLNFYEHIDVMVDHGLVDRYDVWREFSYAMFPLYADARPYIEDGRKEDPSVWKGFTMLMEDMSKQEKNRNGSVGDHPSSADILYFYQTEARLQPGVPEPPVHTRNLEP
jgi:hypothetical protein